MVSGIDDRLHRLWTRPGQTLRGRVNHPTREPLLKNSQDRLPTISRIVPSRQYHRDNYEVVALSVLRHREWGAAGTEGLDDHAIAGYAVRTASALEESGFCDRSGAFPGFGRGREHGDF